MVQGPEPVSRLPSGSADVALGSCLGLAGKQGRCHRAQGRRRLHGEDGQGLLPGETRLLPLGLAVSGTGAQPLARLTRLQASPQFLCVAADKCYNLSGPLPPLWRNITAPALDECEPQMKAEVCTAPVQYWTRCSRSTCISSYCCCLCKWGFGVCKSRTDSESGSRLQRSLQPASCLGAPGPLHFSCLSSFVSSLCLLPTCPHPLLAVWFPPIWRPHWVPQAAQPPGNSNRWGGTASLTDGPTEAGLLQQSSLGNQRQELSHHGCLLNSNERGWRDEEEEARASSQPKGMGPEGQGSPCLFHSLRSLLGGGFSRAYLVGRVCLSPPPG